MSKFGPKNQNRQFDTKTNSNMQNSVVMFTLSIFDWKIPFLGKFGPKTQNCQFKLKFGILTNSNMQNSVVMFTLSVFDWKYPFWVNLVQETKFDNLSRNLAHRLIQICRIQWWCLLFLFLTGGTLFCQIVSKNKNCQFQLKFDG